MRVGILGGSFDPIHQGHLILAEDAFIQLSLDRLLLVVAARAPLRDQAYATSAGHRLRMTALAVESFPGFEVCDLEIERGGVSYSIDTVRELRQSMPDAEFWWILGEDQLAQLSQWRSIEQLVKLVRFAVLSRDPKGSGRDPSIPGLRVDHLQRRQMDISASEVRQRLAQGQSTRSLLPAGVHEYIQTQRLYPTPMLHQMRQKEL
jgi:nicotinate-nucleotide adenylyltransferase